MANVDDKHDEAGTVQQSTLDEIDGAIETVIEKVESDRAAKADAAAVAETPKNFPSRKPAKAKKDEEVHVEPVAPKPGEAKPAEIPDALVERAVKAGLPLAEAKSYPEAALKRICEAMEKPKADDGVPPKAEAAEKVEDDPLDAIPDLDPAEYDEKLVAIVKTLKGIVGDQQKTIKALNAGQLEGKARDEGAWLDGKISALGEDVAKAVDAEKRAALVDKIAVLSAGYKSAGKEVAREAVFEEAKALVLGDVLKRAEVESKSRDFDKRSRLHIRRPSGVEVKPRTDATADVADELNRKFFGKK